MDTDLKTSKKPQKPIIFKLRKKTTKVSLQLLYRLLCPVAQLRMKKVTGKGRQKGAFERLEDKPTAQARMGLDRRSRTRCKGGDEQTQCARSKSPAEPVDEQLSSWAGLQERKFCSITRAIFLPTQTITNRTENRLE